jgi:hypothetical protein
MSGMSAKSERYSKRLKILSDAEIAGLYDRPCFGDEEQAEYFTLSSQEQLLLGSLGSVKSRIAFVLQLGYFKAQRQFFVFDLSDVTNDADHVRARYFPLHTLTDLAVSKVTRLKQQQLILELYNYRTRTTSDNRALVAKARQAAKVSAQPAYIFRTLVDYLAERRVVVPAYSSMQKIVGSALTFEQNRLTSVLQRNLSEAEKGALDGLLENAQGLHDVTQLKRQPKDFSVTEIKREAAREAELRPLYEVAQRLLPELAISNESVVHYASLVRYYTAYKQHGPPKGER